MQRATLILYYGWDFNYTQVRKFWVNVPLASPISLLEQMYCDVKGISICFHMLYIQGCLCNTGVAGIATTGTSFHIECAQQRMTVVQGSSTWQGSFGQPLTAAVAPPTPGGHVLQGGSPGGSSFCGTLGGSDQAQSVQNLTWNNSGIRKKSACC